MINTQHYQFMMLLFGLSAAPSVFTKCMAIVLVFLCKHRVQVFLYLHNWLIKAGSQAQVEDHLALTHGTFLRLRLLLKCAQVHNNPNAEDRIHWGFPGLHASQGITSRGPLPSSQGHY